MPSPMLGVVRALRFKEGNARSICSIGGYSFIGCLEKKEGNKRKREEYNLL